MNKMMIVIAVLIAGIFINAGLNLNSRNMETLKHKKEIVSQNISMSGEIKQKQMFKKSEPKAISDVFALFINQSRMSEIYSGTRMKLVFTGTKENENIEDHYVKTEFRNVKALAVTINVEKSSNETGMAEVLNDIYLLENRTDFKVSEISAQNNVLIVKGELYGI